MTFPSKHIENPIIVPHRKKPLVVFTGDDNKIIIASSGDYPNPDALMKNMAQISEPMDVIIERFDINLLQPFSVKLIRHFIKTLLFFERLFIPKAYSISIKDGDLVIERKPYQEEEKK